MQQYKVLSKVLLEGVAGSYWANMILHYCPACDDVHPYAVKEKQKNGAIWKFNNNFDKPTFSPSMLINYIPTLSDRPKRRCHYFVTDGQIRYCGDCTHDYSGKTITLPDIPEKYLKLAGEK